MKPPSMVSVLAGASSSRVVETSGWMVVCSGGGSLVVTSISVVDSTGGLEVVDSISVVEVVEVRVVVVVEEDSTSSDPESLSDGGCNGGASGESFWAAPNAAHESTAIAMKLRMPVMKSVRMLQWRCEDFVECPS